MKIFFFFSFLLYCTNQLDAQIITHIAGNGGIPPAIGDGGAATAANIAQGGDCATDSWGNLYFCTAHNRIRKVDASTGIITTYAGNGSSTFSGDGGPATAAGGLSLGFIAFDNINNLYIADAGTRRIRKVNASTGIINTIAGTGISLYSGDGGSAMSATFKDPRGITVDASGNIYVADSNRIRKIDAITGIITHFAGTGSNVFAGDGGPAISAQFSSGNLCIDAADNIYVADGTNRRIRKINTLGIISTIAGDGGFAYVSDGVPATSTGFQPYDVASDPSGNIYIADRFNNRVRMVDASGLIHTVAGNGTPGYSGNGGPATAAQLGHPESVTIGHCDGNLYIDDFDNKRFRKVDFSGLPPACTCAPTVTIAAAPNDTVCTGTPVTFTATIASGGTTNTYQWYVNGSVVSTAGNTYTYTPSDIDSVRCVITTSGGVCGSPVTASSNTINMVVITVAPISGTSTLCIGQTTTLASTTTGGTWSSGTPSIASVSGAGVVTGGSAGTAIISYAVSGCYATRVVTVSTPPPAITGTFTVCAGNTTTLSNTSSGGTWSSGNTTVATVDISSGIVTGATAGTAIITYHVSGCYTTATVTVNTSPTVITGSLSLCVGANTTLNSTPSGGTWSSGTPVVATIGTSNGIANALSAGTTTISYFALGCYRTATLTVNSAPSAISGSLTLCEGATTTLSNTASGGTWSSGSTGVATIGSSSGIVAGILAGTANITYALGIGCGNVTTTVTVNTAPSAIGGNHSICVGATMALSNSVSGGVWSSGNTAVAVVSSGGVVNGLSAGTAIVTYALGSCMATVTVTINAPISGITGSLNLCTGQTTTLGNPATGGIWSSDNTTIAAIGSSSGIVTGIAAGTANITYSLGGGCEATAIVTVNLPPNAGTIVGTTNMCIGASVTLSNAVTGGTWSSSNGNATISSGGVVTGILAGTATISYTVTVASCTATAILVVTINALPNAGTISGSATLCIGGTATLNETIAGGKWNSGNAAVIAIDSMTGIVNALSTGTAIITYKVGSTGCTNTAVFTVTVIPPAFIINGSITNVKCFSSTNGSVTISITGGNPPYQYLWSNGGSTPVITGLGPGSYMVNVKETTTQCAKSDTFDVTSPDSLQVTAAISSDLCKTGNGSITTTVSGGTMPYKYAWSNNASTSEIANISAGTYSLTLTDFNGCLKSIVIAVTDTCADVIVNDGISPNGDGINDTWVIAGITYYPANLVQVFDKWGDLVFEQMNYKNDWFGMGKNGSLLPDGNYYYVVKLNAPNLNGGENVFTGSILIKR